VAWEKQFNNWHRHCCEPGVVTFTKVGLNINRAAFDAMELGECGSVDVMLDLDTPVKKMALRRFEQSGGEFKVSTKHKNGQHAAIRCGGVATKLIKAGVMPGRYAWREAKNMIVIDFDRPVSRVGGNIQEGAKIGTDSIRTPRG